jgi:tetratricopeptide (TPR) repeat protein
VRKVIVELNDLVTQIQLAQKSRVKIEEPISYNIYAINENQEQATIALNNNFIHSLVLTNALLRFESNPKDKQELISLCKKEYKGNKNQLDLINEFNDKYMPDQALWWYTRESFFYRMLNNTLRAVQNNIELWLLLRPYISNIYEQLRQHQCKSPIRVYYSQIMSHNEIKYLEHSRTRYLSINSFLLTNINRDKVLNSLNNLDISNGEYPVLFIIDADPNVGTTKSFADISKVSNFIDEGEILFMIGSIFRLIEVKRDGKILTVQMQLCGDNDHDLEHIYESMKKIHEDQNENNKINFRTFGDILHRMGKYDLAEKIYHRLLAELPSNDSSRSDVYRALGEIAMNKHDYDSSLELYHKSLEITKRTNSTDFITIGSLYNCIGEIHLLKKNDKQALESFKKAIKLYQTKHVENHPYMVDFHHNIASIYKRQKKYNEALECYQKALRISDEYSFSNRLSIAKSHYGIGNTYYLLNQYDLAMEHHQLSLAIKLNILHPQDYSIAKSYRNIGGVYKMMGNLKQALSYYQKAAIISHHILPSQHPDVIEIDNEIENFLTKLKFL